MKPEDAVYYRSLDKLSKDELLTEQKKNLDRLMRFSNGIHGDHCSKCVSNALSATKTGLKVVDKIAKLLSKAG